MKKKTFLKVKEDRNFLKLKTESGLLCLGQTLQNFHLVVVLHLMNLPEFLRLNCYLYLRCKSQYE